MDNSRSARIGAACWVLAAPLFLAANVVAGLAWHDPPFSWASHNISDLGNVTCGVWDTTRPRPVCSPWHGLMNVSFVVTGTLLAAGAVLVPRVSRRGVAVRAAQVLLVLAAAGYALAGVFPADVDENLHVLGALLVMGVGNAGLLAAACVPRATVLGRAWPFTLVMGVVATAGTVLFAGQHGLGVGVGGMERVAVFPLPVWASCVGAAVLAGALRVERARPGHVARRPG